MDGDKMLEDKDVNMDAEDSSQAAAPMDGASQKQSWVVQEQPKKKRATAAAAGGIHAPAAGGQARTGVYATRQFMTGKRSAS